MMKRFSLKQLVCPLAASLLTACGSGDESDNQTPEPKPLVLDATNAYYFAMKDADGNWQEKEQTTYTLDKGPYHIVYVCEYKNNRFEVYAEESNYESNKGYEYNMCSWSHSSEKAIKLESADQSINIVSVDSPDLVSTIETGYTIEELSVSTRENETSISAIGLDIVNEKAYAYKREFNSSSTEAITIDFLNDENASEVSYKKIPESASTDTLGYSRLELIDNDFFIDLTFTIEGYLYYINVPASWTTDTTKYKEHWSFIDGTYNRVSKNPTFEPRYIASESPLYTQDLSLNLSNRTVTIEAADYRPTGLLPTYNELWLPSSADNEHSIWFYADPVGGQITFNLVDFSNLPGFPTDQINGFAYESEEFEVTEFQLNSYYSNEYWQEASDLGENLQLYAPTIPELAYKESPEEMKWQ